MPPTQPAVAPTSSGSSADLLAQLVTDTKSAVQHLEARTQVSATDYEVQIAEVQAQIEKAEQLADERAREARLKILHITLQKLREEAAKEEEDLAQAVFGLDAILEQMGQEYDRLRQPSAEDLSLVRRAEAALAQAEQAKVEAGRKRFNFFGSKDKALAAADQDIARAKQAITEAKTEAARRARARLLKANIEQSLQQFQLRVDGVRQIMQNRMKVVEEQARIVAARKQAAFEVKEKAAAALKNLDEELNNLEQDLASEEEVLRTLQNGTPEFAAQDRKISNLRATVEDKRGRRNAALVLYQSKEKFAGELEIHERTQTKLRDNHRAWIMKLQSDTEERIVTFKSRLEAMKAAADQDVAKKLDDMGSEIDFRNAATMAELGAASDRERMAMIEAQPGRMRQIARIGAAQAEALAQIRRREQVALAEFQRRYGIDPTSLSYFTYAGDPNAAPESPQPEPPKAGDSQPLDLIGMLNQ